MREATRRLLAAIAAFLTDPPGWIPAWAMTAVFLLLAWRAATEPLAMAAASIVGDAMKVTIAVWLSYRGVRTLPRLIDSLRRRRGRVDNVGMEDRE